ncbi:right-handed parallel beta-helix repeat-containing protein [Virgisporangium aurantiacum]|uniref:Right handed beta helix domain-containing protein n=1 Tax=Virgisporangium aurantiacum TaxID=175570 RepID=A0A8J3Z882_9ACTN|nr:right-handed parallel beta-helix repeat-containing protein [Virgisporangium aurantiacum]GIJ59299.1 hypothetical protein Vau01_068150 [Virgisporangium aurantiacum]
MEYYVSNSGNDTNPGTFERPFRTVSRGARGLVAGDVLNLRNGVHIGPVDVVGVRGSADDPIVIRSYPGEHAYLDGAVRAFRTRANDDDWIPARRVDPDARDDEYVSATVFTGDLVNRGAFLDRNPYTRLLTYSNLNDLRASNETFEPIVDDADPRPGPAATDEDGNPLGHRLPWVYMGPGLFFDQATGRVHIRLAHTHNNVPEVVDYTEETDPRRVPLAISPKDMTTLQVRGSGRLRFENLTVMHGGDNTIVLTGSDHVTFDHVRIRAGTRGVRTGGTTDVVFAHCQFVGGVPTWTFRTDRTAGYRFLDGDEVVANNLSDRTSDTLLLGNPGDRTVEIHHCEFLNGHNVVLSGQEVSFHHNWINNMQDDALALGFDGGTDGAVTSTRIHQNVITRALTAFSFSAHNRTTRWYLYRNLVDLRGRTRGFRPRRPGDAEVWRFGQLHTGAGAALGPHDLFHNTVLCFDQRGQASFLHYRDTDGESPRRSFNNVFVAVNPGPEADIALTFVPPPSFPGPTDGNLYHRFGVATRDPLRYLAYELDGERFRAGTFADLERLRASVLFEQSRRRYRPGYEANSLLAEPGFRRINRTGRPRDDDDLRPADTSPVLGAGVRLPADLGALDPFRPDLDNPDIGCYPRTGDPLDVGVDGCRSFPAAPGAPAIRPRRPTAGVWKPALLHEFLDGDLGNIRALPGELTVLPPGERVIRPTPDPADRGLLTGFGRSVGYRFEQPPGDVIGVDLGVDVLYLPQPGAVVRMPIVSIDDDRLALRVSHENVVVPGTVRTGVTVLVDGDPVDLGVLDVSLQRPTRLRLRWHTHGQLHLFCDGRLRAYEPGVAVGRSVELGGVDVGKYPQVLPSGPRFLVRRVYLKFLRRDDSRRDLDVQVPLYIGCAPPPAGCVAQARRVHEQMRARTQAFMSRFIASTTTSWRGQSPGPFSPASAAAHAAAVDAARAFDTFLGTREPAAADTFSRRIGDFFDSLAADDPAGYAALVAELNGLADGIDPACRQAFQPVRDANAEVLAPLAALFGQAWQRAQAVRGGR